MNNKVNVKAERNVVGRKNQWQDETVPKEKAMVR